MTKLHIYNDLGIYKNAIKQQIKDYLDMLSTDEANERGLTEAAALINKRTQMYTSTEAECLISWYISSHDECVVDNPEDFHPLQIHTATAKIARYDKAYSKIKSVQIESMESFQLS
jgi:hypothetical protein